MSNLTHRQSTLLPDDGAGSPSWGASYLVTAYSVGGQAASASSGTTITLRAGHGFAVGDKILIDPGTDNTFSGTDTVQSTTSTTIVMTQSYSVALGDWIVNLGVDTGIAAPNYDASKVLTYSDVDATTAITNSTVTADAYGAYSYFCKGENWWELIRSNATTPTRVIAGVGGYCNRFNVVDYGAKLDGSTDDDTEITAAIAARDGVGEGTLFMPSGSDNFGTITRTPWRIKEDVFEIDNTSFTGDYWTNGYRQTVTWTGNNAQSSGGCEGIFAVNRYGKSGSGGGTPATCIALGGYSEHRGDGTIDTNAVCGAELATTMYNTGTIGSGFGALCTAQVESGATATITNPTGVRGIARVVSGGTGTITTARGVSGVVGMYGAGTITTGVAGDFDLEDTGGGSITTAIGIRVGDIDMGATNNYGIRIGGASGGVTTNVALQVDDGEVRFLSTSDVFQAKTTQTYFGPGTDSNISLFFDASTSDGRIRYLGASAVNEFEFNKPVRVNSTAAIITSGTATPEGAVTAPVGSLFLRTDGGADTTLYVKETGAGNTGWQAAVIS